MRATPDNEILALSITPSRSIPFKEKALLLEVIPKPPKAQKIKLKKRVWDKL